MSLEKVGTGARWKQDNQLGNDERDKLSSGGVSLDFHFVSGVKVNHQEISRLFFRLSFDEHFGRFQILRSADPTQTICLDSKNVERLRHAKRLSFLGL
jgi:hypothetical protein